MENWMKQLAGHYERMKARYPGEKFIILFDIDGTILDMRYLIHYVLHAFDRVHHSAYFKNLVFESIDVHEDDIAPLLTRLTITEAEQEKIIAWFDEHRWNSKYLMEAHLPFRGVLEVIRWFTLQPQTWVGLNTARPEELREDTLRSLNRLGREYRLSFDSELLFMNPGGWGKAVLDSKVRGVRYFQQQSYRVVAFIDNEPKNLKAVSEAPEAQEVLLLHADTLFQSQRKHIPPHSAVGREYTLSELILEDQLPHHVQLVWKGIKDPRNLEQFLASKIFWSAAELRLDPATEHWVLREGSFRELPVQEGEEVVSAQQVMRRIRDQGRGVQLSLKESPDFFRDIFSLLDRVGLEDRSLWFKGELADWGESGFRAVRQYYPKSIVECPVHFITPLLLGAPDKAKDILKMLQSWGIDRFTVSFFDPHRAEACHRLQEWGFGVNLEDVLDLESFLQGVLYLPTSLTSNFNFPEWGYHGVLAKKPSALPS